MSYETERGHITEEIIDAIKAGLITKLYYVAHMVQTREGVLDEHVYKSVSQFKVIELNVSGVKNAYFELMHYKQNPSEYHIEEEIEYYDRYTPITHQYIVKNGPEKYTKDFNPRIPSIIYGIPKHSYGINGEIKGIYIDKSMVVPVYTNTPMYLNKAATSDQIGDLCNWKYIRLEHNEVVDGIEYQYLTSDWYILDIDNFPTVEKPLVNIKQKSAFFTNIDAAFDYIEQLRA